ncbi:hypothetical protein [Clostridium sp.]|uniref:hypothetical protein n=1 Tax=Clostridium sp. TaxID=1506 RepID=UPI001DB8C705|nr:hypothetical protein [Clostridium sp.]MBS5307821.1 hypothetical protein [Clostridium sp.]MDU3410134.1 hypothetical protein [Clostridium sp.]
MNRNLTLCKIDIEEDSNCKNCCKECNSKCEQQCIFDKRSVKCDNQIINKEIENET